MRWLGRGRALYKLSIGGHSALVSKDHVCESGFPVRNPFAKGWGCLPCRSLPRAPWGGGWGSAEPHRPGPPNPHPPPGVTRDSHAGRPGPGGRGGRAGAWPASGDGPGSENRREADPPTPPPRRGTAPERQAGSRPGVGDGGGRRQRAWPGLAGSDASPAEGGLARARGSGGLRRDHSPERGAPGCSEPGARSRGEPGRGGGSRPFSVLVFLTARTEPDPEERPREAPGAYPAPGGRVHFAAQAGQLANCGWAGPLSFGGERPEVWEGDAISRRGRAGCGLFVAGGDATGWSRERAHGGPRGSPPPARLASECCAISPFASSAGAHCARGRHRPRPPTSGHREGGSRAGGGGGGRGRSDVGGRGCPPLAAGR